MKEKRRMNPILVRIIMNFTVLLIVLLVYNFAATFANQFEDEESLLAKSETESVLVDMTQQNENPSHREAVTDGYRVEMTQATHAHETQTEPYTDAVYDEDEKEEEEWPERVVFLTFDDGPGWNTDVLLDILYEEAAPSTFFLLGESMLNHSQTHVQVLMERMLAEGHYIGLHSMTHVFSSLYIGYGAPGRFVDEMLQLQGLIYDRVGHHTNLCRAPYGMMSGFSPGSGHVEAVAEAGIKCIDWNVDPQDWRANASAQMILEYVVNQVELLDFPSELVIVLHEHNVTVEALPAVIAFLRENGYVFKAYQPGHEFIYRQYRYRLH